MIRSNRSTARALALLVLCLPGLSQAEPWAAPGDLTLRHDLQLLADQGIVETPLSTWPVSWGDLARNLRNISADQGFDATTEVVLARVRKRVERETRASEVSFNARMAFAERPRVLRTFENTPREDGEVQATFTAVGDNLALKLSASYVDEPADGRSARPDGSYLGIALGNWMLSGGYTEQWWGPGHEGSLILSNNARPVPAIRLQRNNTQAFKTRWLRWAGPWTLSLFAGQLESDRVVPDVKLLGARVNFRPTRDVEIGLTRTAQWGGEGRPETLSSLIDLLLGQDNVGDSGITTANEPGNQLAGIDFRWASPLGGAPYAIYGQFIGEDEAGGLPSRYLGQFGFETWGGLGSNGLSVRAHLEYAETSCDFLESRPKLGCAYNHGTYRTGYRYRGRSIGHAMDGDGAMWSGGLLFVSQRGWTLNLLARNTRLNRGSSSRNTLVPITTEYDSAEITFTAPLPGSLGQISIGAGATSSQPVTASSSDEDITGFVQWQSSSLLRE